MSHFKKIATMVSCLDSGLITVNSHYGQRQDRSTHGEECQEW